MADRPAPDWDELGRLLANGYVDSGFAAEQGGGGVTRLPARQVARDMLSEARADEQVAELRRVGDLAGKRILEVGSGCGMLVVRARTAHGLDVHGIEPSSGEYSATLAVARRLIDHHGLAQDVIREAPGEAIPHPDASFDIVYSSNVLEHVGDPQAVLDEALRVLKPDGHLLFVVPNYGSWWEGHYGVLWLPKLTARAAKIYVRLLGRDPAYIDTLNLIDHRHLKAWLARHAGEVEALDWGWDMFERRLRTLAFSEWAALATVKRLAGLVHRLRLIEPVLWLGRRLHWETPIILHARKLPPSP